MIVRGWEPGVGELFCVLAVVFLIPCPSGALTRTQRLAERGPSTLVVGTIFTLSSPPSFLAAAVTDRPLGLHACRFGHGVKMIGAGAIPLPAGLVAAPFDRRRLPAGWMDGVVDAFQEDYCTRPATSVLP